MMKLKLLVSRQGPKINQNAGDEIEVGADEGKRMLAAGQCELIKAKKREKATKKGAVETAVK